MSPISPNGDIVATSGEDQPDRLTILWDLESGQEQERLSGPKYVDFSPNPDVSQIALRYRDRIAVRDVGSGSERTFIQGEHAYWSLTFSQDGGLLAVGMNSEVQLYDAVSGRKAA